MQSALCEADAGGSYMLLEPLPPSPTMLTSPPPFTVEGAPPPRAVAASRVRTPPPLLLSSSSDDEEEVEHESLASSPLDSPAPPSWETAGE